jgi:hypothetical protein
MPIVIEQVDQQVVELDEHIAFHPGLRTHQSECDHLICDHI